MDVRPSLTVRAGVTIGRVFAGDFGTVYRRTWSVVGDTVNLAARLMAHASPGDIVAHVEVLDECTIPFELRNLPPFTVKGKRAPISAVAVGAITERIEDAAPDEEGPLFGRADEVASLAEALADVASGHGRWICLVGDAGIGKTRLVRELRRTSAAIGWHAAACDLHTALRPYAVLGQLLRSVLGVGAEASEATLVARLDEVVAAGPPGMATWLPLLGPVLRINLPATPEVADLDTDGRTQRLVGLVDDLLTARSDGPLVLLVEDAHDVDPASLEILERLGADVARHPRLVAFVGRTLVGQTHDHREVLQLRPLDADAMHRLVLSACEASPLLPHDVAAIVERAAGNPLFAVELTRTRLHQHGSGELPESVEAILSARIDALRADARHLLRVAAVFGHSLPRDLLVSATVGDVDVESAWPLVREFLVADTAGDVTFRLGLVRDAAYAALPYRLRQDLHGRAADALAEVGYPPGVISYHLLNAGRFAAAFDAAVVAAEQASANHAAAETASLYERALDAARHEPALANDRVAHVAEALGKAAFHIGDLDRALRAFSLARRHRTGDAVALARLCQSTAEVHMRAAQLTKGLQWLTKAERWVAEADPADPEVRELRTSLAGNRTHVWAQQGRVRDAVEIGEAELKRLSGRFGATPAVGLLLHTLDWAHMVLGHIDVDYATRALDVWVELGDLSRQAGRKCG